MPATLPSDLFALANCFRCYGQADTTQLLRLAILAQTLTTLDAMAATDPQSLLEYAKCFRCYSNGNTADLMELALLDQISQTVTGGGGGGVGLSGSGSPEGVVSGAVGQVYTDISNTTNPGFWLKTSGGSGNTGWSNVIAVGP